MKVHSRIDQDRSSVRKGQRFIRIAVVLLTIGLAIYAVKNVVHTYRSAGVELVR